MRLSMSCCLLALERTYLSYMQITNYIHCNCRESLLFLSYIRASSTVFPTFSPFTSKLTEKHTTLAFIQRLPQQYPIGLISTGNITPPPRLKTITVQQTGRSRPRLQPLRWASRAVCQRDDRHSLLHSSVSLLVTLSRWEVKLRNLSAGCSRAARRGTGSEREPG